MENTGIYARISSDVLGQGLGVARQEKDCRELALRRGWTVVEVFTDNDLSAFSGKPRPGYVRMLDAIRSGRIDCIVTWHSDRLHRSPKELEAFIDLIEATGCHVETVQSGPIDLGTPSGRLNARVVGAFARYESEHKSARVRRKLEQNAEAGKNHGGHRPFGWEVDRVTIREGEAEVVRTAARMLLGGHSINSIVRTLNDSGFRNTKGGLWRDVTVRSMLVRARNGGYREHRGVVVARGEWEPILDADTYDRVRLILTDPRRRTAPIAGGRTHLLSGLASCGVCGGTMRAAKGKPYKGTAATIYRCNSGSSCVVRNQDHLDALTRDLVCERLSRPDAVDLLRPREEPKRAAAARAEVEKFRTRLDVAAADYADGKIDAEQLRTITSRIRPRMDAAERLIPPPTPRIAALDSLIGTGDVTAQWDVLDVSVRRQVVDVLLSITVNKSRRGQGFDPASVTVKWKTAA